MTETQAAKEKKRVLHKELRQRTIGYIVTAFGLVAGLAWNNAITAFIEYVYPASSGNGLFAKISYAVIVTVIVVVLTYNLARLADGDDGK